MSALAKIQPVLSCSIETVNTQHDLSIYLISDSLLFVPTSAACLCTIKNSVM